MVNFFSRAMASFISRSLSPTPLFTPFSRTSSPLPSASREELMTLFTYCCVMVDAPCLLPRAVLTSARMMPVVSTPPCS